MSEKKLTGEERMVKDMLNGMVDAIITDNFHCFKLRHKETQEQHFVLMLPVPNGYMPVARLRTDLNELFDEYETPEGTKVAPSCGPVDGIETAVAITQEMLDKVFVKKSAD